MPRHLKSVYNRAHRLWKDKFVHELSLAERTLKTVEAVAARHHATQVQKVRLEIGLLAHVDADALLYCCQLVSRGGCAAEATFEVVRPVGKGWCGTCCDTVEITRIGEACPRCGNFDLRIEAGEELRILDIVVRAD